MKIRKLVLLALALLTGSQAYATFTFTNTYQCWTALLTVCKITVIDNQYMGMTTEDHYIYPGMQVTFPDEGGPYQSYWVQKNQHSVSWILFCGSVVGIIGLPDVVCVGETYQVSAATTGGPLNQGISWFGDATILSQNGTTAVVTFPSSGSKTLFAAAPSQTQPAASAQTIAVTVSYTPVLPAGMAAAGGVEFPPRGGPASVPFNGVAEVKVTFSHNIGTKPLRFKIVNQSDQNGRAVFDGTSELSGPGGVLRVKGTSQTAVTTSAGTYAGRLKISTNTKAGEATCSPSKGFSVCVHPGRIEKIFEVHRINALIPLSPGRWWGTRFYGTFYSDTGSSASGIWGGVSLREQVIEGSHTGLFTNFGVNTSDWLGVGASRDEDYYTVGGGSYTTASLNQFVVNGSHQGSATDYQFYQFTCARCGMCAIDGNGRVIDTQSSPAQAANVPKSGFQITQWFTHNGAGTNYVMTSVVPHSGVGYTGGTIQDTSNRATPLTNGP